jgi:hypothetical protein
MSFAKVFKSDKIKAPVKKAETVAKAMVLRKIVKKSEVVEKVGSVARALGQS